MPLSKQKWAGFLYKQCTISRPLTGRFVSDYNTYTVETARHGKPLLNWPTVYHHGKFNLLRA